MIRKDWAQSDCTKSTSLWSCSILSVKVRLNINVDYLWTSASREQSCSMRKNNTCINPSGHRHHCLCLRLLRLRLLLCADRGSCAGLVCALGALGVMWEIHWLVRGRCMRAHDSVRWRWRRPRTMRRSSYGLHIASREDICAKYMGKFSPAPLGMICSRISKMVFLPSTRSGKVTSSSLLNWMKGQILNPSVSRPLRSMTLRRACTNCHTFSLGNMAEGSWYWSTNMRRQSSLLSIMTISSKCIIYVPLLWLLFKEDR